MTVESVTEAYRRRSSGEGAARIPFLLATALFLAAQAVPAAGESLPGKESAVPAVPAPMAAPAKMAPKASPPPQRAPAKAAPANTTADLAAPAKADQQATPVRAYAGLTIRTEAPNGNRYVGSKTCARCHEDSYNGWQQTYHSTVIQDAKKTPGAIKADFSQADLPFTRDEVEYTIGSHWDQRYMKRIGDEYYVLPRLWSVQAREWRPYSVWSWAKRPYSKFCVGCHTAFYDPVRKTIAEEGIGCEACHGPGGFHADSDGAADKIINPAKLSIERYNMVCASCHVRGTDPTGEYSFQVGFVPGDDLTKYLIPLEMKEGETVRGAISRIYRDWQEKKLQASRARCEVCGIPGTQLTTQQQDDAMEFCFSCHAFRTRYQLHTRHGDNVKLTCSHCHIQRDKDKNLKKSLDGNIHSYSYFLVHTQNCYEPNIAKACTACHDKPRNDGKEPVVWAAEVIESWKKPIDVGH